MFAMHIFEQFMAESEKIYSFYIGIFRIDDVDNQVPRNGFSETQRATKMFKSNIVNSFQLL